MKSIREQFGQTLSDLAKKNKKIVAISCDLRGACKLNTFAKKFPKRFIEVGIAEANGVGIASGLALNGFKPFLASFSSFITGKNIEIRCSISYNNSPVVIIGTHGGMIGADGATQSGLQDISVMRSLPNFHVYQPCSNLETTQIIDHVSKLDKPAYVRIARNVIPEFLPKNYKFKFKKLTTIKNGKEIAIISSGPMLYNCLKAIEKIKDKEKFALLNLSTIKPLNEKQIVQKLKKFQRIITVEDHTIEGGIGSVIAEVMSNSAYAKKIQMLGITNKFINSDNPTNLEKKFKLDINNLYKIINNF
jgi:transketolase